MLSKLFYTNLINLLRKSVLSPLAELVLRTVPTFFVSTSLAKLRFAGCLILVLCYGSASAKGFIESLGIKMPELQSELDEEKKPIKEPVFYELVHENMRPDADEFYVNGIFTIKGRPKVTIARSQNTRAGPLYENYVSYGIGDYIADDYKIQDILVSLKEIIVVKESTKQYYGLTMGYGTAVSRLIKKPDYEVIEKISLEEKRRARQKRKKSINE